MAQRAALARALINHPKVLLLDEPLGALDQFTRMRMQDEVLRLWQARGTTMVLVTHDIDEAIYMSDRIVIMTPRPGRIERTIDVALERPRQRNSPRFLELRAEILEMLHFAGGGADESRMGNRTARGSSPGLVAGGPVMSDRSRSHIGVVLAVAALAACVGVAAFFVLRRAGNRPRRHGGNLAPARLGDLPADGLRILLGSGRPRRQRDRARAAGPDRATELVPMEPAAWADLGLLEMRLRDYEAAARDLEQARAGTGERRHRADARPAGEPSGQYDEAITHLQRAVELAPGDLKARFALSRRSSVRRSPVATPRPSGWQANW